MGGKAIGALWTAHSQKGLEYYSGNIQAPFDVKQGERIKIVIFANTKKEAGNPEHENQPDYNILLSTPKGGQK